MYKKVKTNLEFVDREKEVLQFWKVNKIFEKSIEQRKGKPVFTFFDGPPTANGKPHIGHILTRVIKDIIPRYKTMKGYKVLRKAGWDTHGLPVEIEVEKALGLDGKSQIESYGVEPFIKKCKESVWKYSKEWEKMSDHVGYWADMGNPYITYTNEYIESVWWALKTIWEKNLIYKGHKVIPYCPRCGTALSSHEVDQGYKDICEKSIYVKFKIKETKNEYILAWTTTPWTLPSNVALTVNPEVIYAKVKCGEEIYVIAESLIEKVIESDYEIIEKFKGNELEGVEYEPLFDFAKPKEKAFYVVSDNFVTTTDGTGVVHTAPAFGEEDARVGAKYKLPFVQMVNEEGKFIEDAYLFTGIFVKDADPLIIKNLDERKLLFKEIEYEHSYPFCWRCDTPLLYYARSTWFIKMTELKDKLMENNKKINWYPPAIGEGRFGNFLENVVDWSLSRERYWGTPLPIWECECGHRDVIGSINELKEKGIDVPDNIELHKPYIDDVYIKCEKCGKKMKRVPEVIDCWFDSGSMPFAQWHYPFENKEVFEQNYPADFISEALDQTRGWFYALHAISTLLFEDKPAYKNVIVLGLVQDKTGQKMSKHKGNVVDPWTVLDKQGADAVRWYFYTSSAPWLPSRFYNDAVSEGQRKFMGTFWNTYAFYILYADIDKFNPMDYTLEYDKLTKMDKWILSRLNSLVCFVDKNLEEYKITESAREMQKFIEDLSNWYVRRSRERFWEKGMEQDKINAYMTLYTVLETMTRLSAPFIPFMAEGIYCNLVKTVDKNASESVHLCNFPTSKKEYINKELEENMDEALKVVVLGRSCRNSANIKNRQPIGMMYVKDEKELDESYINLIKDELNIKQVEYFNDIAVFSTYSLKPQLKTVGPKYGKYLNKIKEWLKNANGNDIVTSLNSGKNIIFEVEGQKVELCSEDILTEIVQKEGYVTESDRNIAVVMDINLNDELIEEGFVRELISKIQTMRKEAGFEVMDFIEIAYSDNNKIKEIFENNREIIMSEVLAKEAYEGKTGGYEKEWKVNGEKVLLSVKK